MHTIELQYITWMRHILHILPRFIFFFFNDTATTEIYTLSLHDALPISIPPPSGLRPGPWPSASMSPSSRDRKSTRLNSSHGYISYAVFCLKKKKLTRIPMTEHQLHRHDNTTVRVRVRPR